MITGDRFAAITDKRLMGYDSFGELFLDYLRFGLEYVVSKIYTRNGTFGSTKINIQSVSNDTFQLNSDGSGVSSEGHFLEYSDSGTDYDFENQTGQTYQVGFHYSEHPVSLDINPLTGQPEFTSYEEACGGEAVMPGASVVDNLDGTLTINVNGAVEPGVNNSGRQVRVWKIIPGINAVSLSVAIETCIVQYSGGNNFVVTVGNFGQTTVDTDASKYLVQLIGPYVSRDSSIKTNGYWYIGEITGNGPSATPSSFDMSDQHLIMYSLSEIIDAANITIDDSNFHDAPADDNTSGGIGSPYSYLQGVLDAIDKAIVRRRSSIGLADGSTRTLADYVGVNSIEQINTFDNGGDYHVQDGNYQLGTNVNIGSLYKSPRVVGEIGSSLAPTIALSSGRTAEASLIGHFKRLKFRTLSSSYGIHLGFLGSGSGGNDTLFENCQFDSGHVRIYGYNSDIKAIVIRDCEIRPGTTAGIFDAAFRIGFATANYEPHIIFDNCVIRGPHASATSQEAVLKLENLSPDDANPDDWSNRQVVFRNCLIIHDNDTTIPTIDFEKCGKQPIYFQNCIIKGITGQTVPVINADGFDNCVYMSDCVVYAPSGQAINLPWVDGALENVTVIGGDDTTVSDPQLVYIASGPHGVRIRNMNVYAGAGSCRATGTPSKPVVQIGGDTSSNGPIELDGMYIKPTSVVHYHNTLYIVGSKGTNIGSPSVFRNIKIDLNGVSAMHNVTSATSHLVHITGTSVNRRCFLENFSIVDLKGSGSGPYSPYNLILLEYVVAKGIYIQQDPNYGGSNGWQSLLNLTYSMASQVVLQSNSSYGFPSSNSSYGHIYVNNSILRDVDLTEAIMPDGNASYIRTGNRAHVHDVYFPDGSDFIVGVVGALYINGDDNIVSGCHMPKNATVDQILIYINNADRVIVTKCILRGAGSTTDWIQATATSTEVLVHGNVLKSTNATNPLITLSGADSSDADNIKANT